jgi:hypothetical protein
MSNLPPSGEIPRGAIRFNTDSNKPELWDGSQWAELQLSTPNLGRSVDTQPGARGIIRHSAATDTIDYLNISSAGNAVDFGDTSTIAKTAAAMCSSSTRGLMMGGYDAPTANFTNHIEFLTIASTGSAGNDFGDLVTATYVNAACSNATRGISAGGIQIGVGNLDKIEYVTIASQGVNAQTFGTLSGTRYGSEGLGSPVRGLFGGGYAPSNINTIDMITISSLGSRQDYGDLSTALASSAGVSNAVRGLFAGTGPNTPSGILNVIEYVTIAAGGNAVNFGDLTVAGRQSAGLSSSTRGVFAGRNTNPGTPATSNIIDYVNIATQGDAVDFGDLTAATNPTGCSNAHGGL